jgi:TolB-like protein/DNA-binding winged helix-turn-helix (wHTH) protein/Flp pilus assembly protein TadD
MPEPAARQILRFDQFELDLAAYELRRQGRPVRLERLPMDLLVMLVERRGDLVSRSEIVDRLWGKDVFVDVETGINTAIRKIRQALRDSAEAPRMIVTVPGRGYRFVAAVEIVAGAVEATTRSPGESAVAPDPGAVHAVVPTERQARPRLYSALVVAGFVALAAFAAWWFFATVQPPARVVLAVLPFDELSGEPGREYLADGLTEETIASLGQIDPERVGVVGRQSMMVYRDNTTKSLAEIGREVGADYLLESSLRAEDGHFRITAKLIRARDQVQVWSESYDREPTSLLDLQRELSAAIAQQIRLRLSPDRLDAMSRRQTRNADAYDLYLRGRNFVNLRTPATAIKAIEYFDQATKLDPDYALAWAGLTEAYGASPINSDAPPRELGPRARAAAAEALRAAPNLADAQFAMAYVNWMFDWNWTAAESGFRRATTLDAHHTMSHVVLGHLLSQTGRHERARASMQRARELDPLNPMPHAVSSQVEFQARDHSAALDHARLAVALDPEFWIGYIMQGQALERMNQQEPALEALTKAGQFSGQNSKPVALRGYMLAKMGRVAEARDVLKTLKTAARERYVPPYAIALVHAGLGDTDAVFESLADAYLQRDVHLIFLTVDPKWDDYRQDDRFIALLSRCGFLK